jgi:hypothetical protein
VKIEVEYSGPPITVDESQIAEGEDLRVPHLGRWDAEGPLELGDDHPGAGVAGLVLEALNCGALVVPPEVRVECYSDDDDMGGGFILAIYPAVGTNGWEHSRGVTFGWREAENVALRDVASEECEKPERIAEALCFIARELNAMLGVKAVTR